MSDEPNVNWWVSPENEGRFGIYHVEGEGYHSFGFSPHPNVNIPADEVDTIELREPLYEKLVQAVHEKADWPGGLNASIEKNPRQLRFVDEETAITFRPKLEVER